jgi:hypothetical protein
MGNAYSLYRVMQTAIKERNKGRCTLSLLRTLKFDGRTQAIPVANLVVDAKYKLTSSDDSETYERFDWIAVKDDEDNDNKKVVELSALLELRFPGNEEGYESVFFFMAADTFRVPKIQPDDNDR